MNEDKAVDLNEFMERIKDYQRSQSESTHANESEVEKQVHLDEIIQESNKLSDNSRTSSISDH